MSFYSDNASILFERYHNTDSTNVHGDWLHHLPKTPGLACDIGAGTGRDANWLASKGWDVIAVEPEAAFREKAKQQSSPSVSWMDDKLPELSRLRKLNRRFNLILISAVWMHLPESKRKRAFRILTEMLAPSGTLVISLRHSTNEQERKQRGFFPVSVSELEQFAKERAVSIKSVTEGTDGQEREYVSWQTVVLELPDDGTGSLPLLRHIIVNDDKAATYKLGLLRTLIRIADGAPGMVLRQNDNFVEVPFGLVGLYWIKLYMPLVLKENLIQSPTHNPVESSGLGFAQKKHFYRLAERSAFDLRVGSSFDSEWAPIIIGSIRDACANIQKMPAHFITYPGQSKQVFQCERYSTRYRSGSHWRIDKESLSAFGVFRIPLTLWQCLGQYTSWIEPAILNEWARLMNSYDAQYDRSMFDRVFQWEDNKRSTLQVRRIANEVQKRLESERHSLLCIWSGKRLKHDGFEIDHCFPWRRWYNNDLWNLLPTSRQANNEKREKLPSAALMHKSRERILEWWELAYNEAYLQEQFKMEAESALPLVYGGNNSFVDVFDAMLYQRARLRVDQQLVEWK